MRRARRFHHWAMAMVVVGLLAWAFSGVGRGGLGDSWRQVLASIAHGFAHPDLEFVYRGTGEDLLGALALTIAIAFVGTVWAALVAGPLAFVAAQRSGGRLVASTVMTVFTVLRTFPDLILGVIFVVIVGPGPFAGSLAIAAGSIGMLGRLFAEEVERLTPGPDDGLRAVGATGVQVLVHSQLPRVIPEFLSLTLNRLEISVRSASILGMVGAGGIGAPILFAVSSRSWDRVAILFYGMVVTVSMIDAVSGALRRRMR